MTHQKLTAKLPTSTGLVYHVTDTARLSWIFADGVLKPGGWPPPYDFVWATSNPRGDRTASAFCWNGYRDYLLSGHLALVRITFCVEDFEPWSAVAQRLPPEHVRKLEDSAREFGVYEKGIRRWYVRPEPQPLSRAIRVQVKCVNRDWRTIDLATACVAKVVSLGDRHSRKRQLRGVVLGGDVYVSHREIQRSPTLDPVRRSDTVHRTQPVFYHVCKMSVREWAALR